MKRVLLFAALIAWSGMASAVVYKWVDAQGKTLYGDRPPDGVHAEVVELLGTHVAPPTRPAAAPAGATAPAGQQKPAAASDATKKDSDSGAEQAQRCADAQDRFKKLSEGRHLYKEGTSGERQYMTSQEIDTERADAKREIDAVCGAQS